METLTEGGTLASDSNVTILEDDTLDSIGSLFYLVNPGKHAFSKIDQCPDHLDKALPYMIVLIVLEAMYNTLLRGRTLNLADSVTNINFGILMVLAGVGSRVLMISTYSWIYQNYRILDLPWDSTFTWILAAVAVDFGYYWFHRASHEIGFLWAIHQAHHSSEEMNLTTALRQPVLEGLGWITHWFYLPCALLIPTTQMLVHSELNFLYQFWIHTEVIGNLGPLELIFNTASQHRVHHGANRYCIDKNYGGYLSVWDRLFGTYADEKQDEELVYGLVDQPKFYNIFKLNYFYFQLIHEKAKSTGSLKAWFFGPGWFPGLPRLGDVSSLPQAPTREKHRSTVSRLGMCTVIINSVFILLILDYVTREYLRMNTATFSIQLVLACLSAYTSGLILDGDQVVHLNLIRFFLLLLSWFVESTADIWEVQFGLASALMVLSLVFDRKKKID